MHRRDDPEFQRLLTAYLGGEHVVEMLTLYHVDKHSYRDIARRFEMGTMTAHQTLRKARVKLRHIGMLPKDWETTTSRVLPEGGRLCG